MKIKILDWYIIRKFLGTFFFALGLIIAIAIVFDISEKIDDFLEKEAPMRAIVFDYYLNFIPFFGNLFSPLFVFISVIYFTSRMASQTEIVAILSSGVSFKRLLVPYMVGAAILASISLYLNNYVIPHSNTTRIAFETKYIKNPFIYKNKHVHRQIAPGEFIYFESFNNIDKIGYQFSFEKFKDGKLTYKLLSDRVIWDSVKTKWTVESYFIRHIDGMNERVESGFQKDTVFAFTPDEFSRRSNYIETMDTGVLNDFIKQEQSRGSEEVPFYLVEKYRRTSFPFATFILTIIGVSLSSRKVRGGIGVQIGAGILLSFTYIMFMQVSQTFATNGNMPAILAVWLPNIFFSIIAAYLLRSAMK
ncbi:MAG TPA: LptF/LptG family permease [Bacteroidia bacterium]|nr:LptF/LptG family permease [Bacteroidia bacterium]HQK97530.1 LptF/LptG family permease [Bacteroidia bacterium]